MALSFRFEVEKCPNPQYGWEAIAFLHDDADCTSPVLAFGYGESPGAAVERVENAARMALEKLLGVWGNGFKP